MRLINSDKKTKLIPKTGIRGIYYIDTDGMKQYVQIRGKKYQKSRYDFYTRGSCKSYDMYPLIIRGT